MIANEYIDYYYATVFDHSDVDGYEPIARSWAGMEFLDPFYVSGSVMSSVAGTL